MSTPDPAPPFDPLDCPWRPAVDDVAALLRARTKDASGAEVGTFTDKTRPTDAEVEQLITNGTAKVASYVGWAIPDETWAEAMHLSALVAACEVETSYYPEQIGTERSAYQPLWTIFTYDIGRFADYVSALLPPGVGVGNKLGTIGMASGTVVWAYQFGWFGAPMSDTVNVGLGRSRR